LGNGLAAITLFFIGQLQLIAFATARGQHSDGFDLRQAISPAQRISYCVNFPAFVLAGVARLWTSKNIKLPHHLVVMYSDMAYLVAVVAFWWWFGYLLDKKRFGSYQHWSVSKGAHILELSLGTIVVLILSMCVVLAAKNDPIAGHAVPLSGIAWCLLSLYLLVLSRPRRESGNA
jgi:hypothetical protein